MSTDNHNKIRRRKFFYGGRNSQIRLGYRNEVSHRGDNMQIPVTAKHTIASLRLVSYLTGSKDTHTAKNGSKEHPAYHTYCPLALSIREKKGWIKIRTNHKGEPHTVLFTFKGGVMQIMEMVWWFFTRRFFISVDGGLNPLTRKKYENNEVVPWGTPFMVKIFGHYYETDLHTTRMIECYDNNYLTDINGIIAISFDAVLTESHRR